MVEQVPEVASVTLSCWLRDGACEAGADNRAKEIAGRAASALGITEGPVTCRLALPQGEIVGIAARVSGTALLDRAIAAALSPP